MEQTNFLPLLTFEEVEQKVTLSPVLLLPIGGMEPVGARCTLGIVNEVTDFISDRLSQRCGILKAPLLSYSNTTAFRAFGGSIGIKRNIFESLICNLIKDSSSWGIRKIFIFDGSYGTHDLIRQSIAHIEKRRTNKVSVYLFCWQREKEIRSLISKYLKGRELARSEFAIMSLAAYFKPYLIRQLSGKKKKEDTLDENIYEKWLKRGEDPDKFRKLYPKCSTSFIKNEIDPQFGKVLLDSIVDFYGNRIIEKISDKIM